jgi:hypothetical protein
MCTAGTEKAPAGEGRGCGAARLGDQKCSLQSIRLQNCLPAAEPSAIFAPRSLTSGLAETHRMPALAFIPDYRPSYIARLEQAILICEFPFPFRLLTGYREFAGCVSAHPGHGYQHLKPLPVSGLV